MARARKLIANKSTTSQVSPPNAQNDFSKSLPDLSFRQSGGSSTFGQSHGTGTQLSEDKPDYWGRVSRFVPQHLYGKGVEAIKEYRQLSRASSSNTPAASAYSQPLNLSSPILIQQSYVPEGHSQDGIFDNESVQEEEIDGDDEMDTEEDSDSEADEEDNDGGMDSEEEYGRSHQGQNAQARPGSTQDDAIQLSD